MYSKYLSGLLRVTSKEDKSVEKLKRVIFLMRKTDSVQHADMASFVGFRPDSGGFVFDFESEPLVFTGESISCQVATLKRKDDLKLISQNSTWYKCLVQTNDQWGSPQKYWLFQLVNTNDNIEPFDGMGGHINWEPCTQLEASGLMLKECEESNY